MSLSSQNSGGATRAWPHNKRMNLSVSPVTGLANGARPAPCLPAGYAQRYAVFPGVAYILKRRFNS